MYGIEEAIKRAKMYVNAGADAIFPEALKTEAEFKQFAAEVKVPLLANMTEFGKTPLLTTAALAACDVDMVLYPLSAFRAMSQAALNVYETIRRDGTQSAALESMQTRADLYAVLGYHQYEQKLDELFAKEKTND